MSEQSLKVENQTLEITDDYLDIVVYDTVPALPIASASLLSLLYI